ncbi:MAG: SDR family oxidoreductase [Gammaproteobacteria bacterium]|nr:SDR family oxidoreductase [Gammaproteobacteria bacterium]
MKVDLSGKRIVITGASSGLGEHFAHVLSRSGANLGVMARREENLESLAVELEGRYHNRVVPLQCDVSEPDSIEQAVAAVHDQLGGIDVLINNAGVSRQSAALQQTLDDWDAVIDTNLRGCWLTAVATAKLMVANNTAGNIVNIASVLGFGVSKQVAPYSISKAGVVQMTKVLALEWARHGIRVNGLAPGYIRTEINQQFFESPAGKELISRLPQGRLGQPEDLDGALLLLVSEASAFMTGTVIPVDGGYLVSSP